MAEPLQSSEDIVEFFANAADLGVSRGICVGTEDECNNKTEAAAQTGLDMLINFELNSADLTTDAQAKLGQFAEALKDNRLKAHSFVVEGHTDASGATDYNDELSQKRAQSVTAFLLSAGIEAARISPIGMGEAHPRADDPYDPLNRRVEMRINLQ
jgi:outer membrane protein OmpA-like peptidoglycan-associated protein